MSSIDLEKYGGSPRAASERILLTLKMQGALTSAQVGEQLAITGEAARQQLVKLAQDGFVTEESRAAGRGRPAIYWHLTDKGHDRFPDRHAALTVEILRSVSDLLGEEALTQIIEARETATETQYAAAMTECRSLRERVERLAELRSAEGYMATVEEGADGAILLMENHCPICAAASACQRFCRAEKAVFQRVLGEGVEIERVEHIVAGGRRCTYRISESTGG